MTTKSADPWTEHGYADWRDAALQVRRQWMEMMGLDEDEINRECRLGTVADFDEELSQYNAMIEIERMNDRCDSTCN